MTYQASALLRTHAEIQEYKYHPYDSHRKYGIKNHELFVQVSTLSHR